MFYLYSNYLLISFVNQNTNSWEVFNPLTNNYNYLLSPSLTYNTPCSILNLQPSGRSVSQTSSSYVRWWDEVSFHLSLNQYMVIPQSFWTIFQFKQPEFCIINYTQLEHCRASHRLKIAEGFYNVITTLANAQNQLPQTCIVDCEWSLIDSPSSLT